MTLLFEIWPKIQCLLSITCPSPNTKASVFGTYRKHWYTRKNIPSCIHTAFIIVSMTKEQSETLKIYLLFAFKEKLLMTVSKAHFQVLQTVPLHCKQRWKNHLQSFRETFPFSEIHMKHFQQQQRFLNPVLKFVIHLFPLAPTWDISHLSAFGWLKI